MTSPTATVATLAEALPLEQARCRKILAIAKSLPPQSGFFLVACLEAALGRAERAAAEGDVIAMVHAYQELKEFEA